MITNDYIGNYIFLDDPNPYHVNPVMLSSCDHYSEEEDLKICEYEQLSFGQKPIEINEDSLQFTDWQMEGSCSDHEEHNLHKSSYLHKEYQEDYLPFEPFVLVFDIKVVGDEEGSDIEYQEHITYSLSEIVSCNRPTHHSDEFKSQGYDEGEQESLDHQLIIHFSTSNTEQSTFNMDITESHQHKYFNFQLEQQLEEVFLFDFDDPITDYFEIMSNLNIKIFLLGEEQFYHLFQLHLCLLWFLIFLGSKSSMMSVNHFLTWLHWKHDFT